MAMTPRGEGRKGRKAMRVLCIGAVALARGLQSAGAAPSAAPSLLRGGLEWSGSGLGSSHTSGVPSTSGRGADVPLAAAEAPGEMAAALRTMFPHSVECPAPWAAPACAARHRELAEFTHRLSQCSAPAQRTERVLAHRGAPLVLPEHTRESYALGIKQGAGWGECDVAVTKDLQLVCRHSQCDLHHTTDVLRRPELAAKCSVPFRPYDPASGRPAEARCCTYDFTVAEFKTLCGTMDGEVDPRAARPEDFYAGAPRWRDRHYGLQCGEVMTHAESAAMFRAAGVNAVPELKTLVDDDVPDYDLRAFLASRGRSTTDLADQLQGELAAAGYVHGKGDAGFAAVGNKAAMQTFDWQIARHWANSTRTPVVYLFKKLEDNPTRGASDRRLAEAAHLGIEYVAPGLWDLVVSEGNRMVASERAAYIKGLGLGLMPWTLERSGCADGRAGPCGRFYRSTEGRSAFEYADILRVMDVLLNDIQVDAVFSDFPLTSAAFANCLSR